MQDYTVKPFTCAMCGNCCRGEGYVRVTPADILALSSHLRMGPDQFRAEYTRIPEDAEHAMAGDLWLRDKPGPAKECIFLEGNACQVHEAKPVQCVGFPLKWRTPDVIEYCVGMQQ